jgi:protoheme IX farnesyltransferase
VTQHAATLALPQVETDVIGAIVETTKPRITRLVTITAGVGFALGALGQTWTAGELALAAAACILGTGLSAAGANALNQWWERDRDARMQRTAGRPIPSGRLSSGAVLGAALAMSVVGPVTLLLNVGAPAAAVALATILIYVLVYTPSKPLTPLSTIIGAVPGALPPVIGWAAARPEWSALAAPGAWSLFLIMFVWQVPHFIAIAWMYREDYARGGYRVLPCMPDGEARSARVTLVWTALTALVSLAPAIAMPGRVGGLYVLAAMALGAFYLRSAIRLVRSGSDADARASFIASVIYLPLLLIALVVDVALGMIF